ncbi:MAG TPA: phosphoribosyltransferase family protein [Thermomicrobiales bacterium]
MRSAALFDGWLRQAIHAFKYQGETARAEHLAALLAPLFADLAPFDIVCPVPLHPKRERARGYNQARLLATVAGRAGGYRVEELATRIRPTQQQVHLSAAERQENMRGAFATLPVAGIRGARIVLVDDVLTTGATLGNCAEALLAAGATSVAAVTLARES